MPTSAAETRFDGLVVPDLRGRRVLVTGASSGIGAALALAFGQCGAVVGVHCHRGVAAAQALGARIGTAHVVPADLSQPGAADALIGDFVGLAGGLDVLVNNAGGPETLQRIEDMDDRTFDAVFDLNARSVLALCRAAVPVLRQAGAGASIINVTSLSARLGSGPGASVYGGAKAFVTAMTKTLARELAPDGIRVNALSPGFVATPLHDRISSPQMVSNWVAQIPLGRAGRPDDCAGPALFLASPALSGFLTGQCLEVNGGQYMGG